MFQWRIFALPSFVKICGALCTCNHSRIGDCGDLYTCDHSSFHFSPMVSTQVASFRKIRRMSAQSSAVKDCGALCSTQGPTVFDVYLWSFKLSFQFNDFYEECWLSPPPSRTGAWSKSEAKSVRGKTTASTKLPSTTTPKGNSKVIIKIIKICWAVRVDDCQQQTHISYTTTPNPYHGILKMIIESFVNYCAVQVDGC